jgi:hypothetical protein
MSNDGMTRHAEGVSAALRAQTEFLDKLVSVCRAVGWQAGVGECETAGLIISLLAKRPHLIAEFMQRGAGVFIDDKTLGHECGELTFFSQNGDVLSPEQLAALHAAAGGAADVTPTLAGETL